MLGISLDLGLVSTDPSIPYTIARSVCRGIFTPRIGVSCVAIDNMQEVEGGLDEIETCDLGVWVAQLLEASASSLTPIRL